MQWVIEEKQSGMTIHSFLRLEKQFSRRILKAVKFDGGKITVNGTEKTVRYVLNTGDYLQVQLPKEERGTIKAVDLPLDIVYEDDAILIINKQPGIATIPSFNHPKKTITNGVLAYYERNNIPYTVHIVTRLDRDTSGLLLIAKHRYSHSLLAKAQQEGAVQRYYTAIVEGKFCKKKGKIDANIGRKEGSIIERKVRADGQYAITNYKVMKEMKNMSLVEINLETGRTHQIRVHMAWLGHPLVGDDLYGACAQLMRRQALHCSKLVFPHPITKKQVEIELPLPTDMEKLTSE